jgi:hypothetical protein
MDNFNEFPDNTVGVVSDYLRVSYKEKSEAGPGFIRQWHELFWRAIYYELDLPEATEANLSICVLSGIVTRR